jgi:transcriptional regulator with XRE-family HTH domain
MSRVTAIDVLIGRNMRTLRSLRGLEQAHISERMVALGHPTWIHQQTVSEVERGRRAVLVSEAIDLAACLNVTLAKLLSTKLL